MESQIEKNFSRVEELLKLPLPYTLLPRSSTPENDKFFKLLSVGEILPSTEEYTSITQNDLCSSKYYNELSYELERCINTIQECLSNNFRFNTSQIVCLLALSSEKEYSPESSSKKEYSPETSSSSKKEYSPESREYYFVEKNGKIPKFLAVHLMSLPFQDSMLGAFEFKSTSSRRSGEGMEKILSSFTDTKIRINSISIYFSSKGMATFVFELNTDKFRGVMPQTFKIKRMIKLLSSIFASEENFICFAREAVFNFLDSVKFRIVTPQYEIVQIPFYDIYERV